MSINGDEIESSTKVVNSNITLSVTPYDKFVRDWRVAGAMMEKFTWNEFDNVIWDIFVPAKESRCNDHIDPRAVIEACVEALS